MSQQHVAVFTIGHSNHSIDRFVGLLAAHEAEQVIDVRSSPFSRFNPQFNRHSLEASLNESGIGYLFMGKELGARSEDPSCYEDGRVQYERLAASTLFLDGIAHVIREASRRRSVLMCAEQEPLDCHRTLLVSRALAARGVTIKHILPDGKVEQHEATLQRLLEVTGLPALDLFRTREDLLAEAFARRERKVAHVDASLGHMGRSEPE